MSSQGQPADDGPSSSTSPSQSRGQYLCLQSPCAEQGVGFDRKADLERHVRAVHERDITPRIDCEHPSCHRKGDSGFTRKDKMVDHMREVHTADIPKKQSGVRRSSRR